MSPLQLDALRPDADGAYSLLGSPIGDIALLAGSDGLRSCWLGALPDQVRAGQCNMDSKAHTLARQHLDLARLQIEEYFAGTRHMFELDLAPCGTEFQRKVWTQLSLIYYGEATSYAELASRCGTPKAFRAVGGANGKNPLPLIVPCHRVISADGSLGGFSSGLHIKRWLLAFEGVEIKP